MIKKCYIILLVFCFFMLFCITDVLATEVTDRDIAIACILASGNHSDGITVAQDLGTGPDRIRNYGVIKIRKIKWNNYIVLEDIELNLCKSNGY